VPFLFITCQFINAVRTKIDVNLSCYFSVMSNLKRRITILIGVIGILLVLLAGAIGYIIGNSNILYRESTSKATISDDKKLMKEIEELKIIYDSKIAEKTNNYKALKEEREKVQILVAELEKSKNDSKALVKYKTEYQSLESKMKVLVNEIVILKKKKTNIVTTQSNPKIAINTTKSKLNNTNNSITHTNKEIPAVKSDQKKDKSDNFFAQKDQYKSNKVESEKLVIEVKKSPVIRYEKFEKITLSNVKALAYNLKSGTKLIETDASSKADLIKIDFTVDGIANAKPGEKTYYIQIINSKNNVVGKRISEYFDNETLTYSLSKTINYNNHSQDCTIDFPYKDFEKGVYFINIFDRNDLVGKSSFTLK